MFLLTSSYYVKLNVMEQKKFLDPVNDPAVAANCAEKAGVVRSRITCEENIFNFDSLACVCGLTFPDTATQFQKATLTLAHLMASVRESILHGSEVPVEVINWINDLTMIIVEYGGEQR